MLCASALLCVPQLASAEDEQPAAFAARRVQDGLLQPLAANDAHVSRFSRAAMPPMERRVRVTQEAPRVDKSGRAFLTFAVDNRFGKSWRENAIVGCAYLGSGELFVKLGASHRPAAVLLGKRGDAVSGACEEARLATAEQATSAGTGR